MTASRISMCMIAFFSLHLFPFFPWFRSSSPQFVSWLMPRPTAALPDSNPKPLEHAPSRELGLATTTWIAMYVGHRDYGGSHLFTMTVSTMMFFNCNGTYAHTP